jgi:topoisomerase-4 subunit B
MYIGGTDERAFHHLAAEVLDNSMDEAVAGYASRIEMTLEAGNRLTISDNGRGIPVDNHPKYTGKSALEVILTTSIPGGKFSDKAYATSGGLHGVGVSVVNALSTETIVEVAATRSCSGRPSRKARRHRTWFGSVRPEPARDHDQFVPDASIFGEEAKFKPARLYRLARSKAYLFAVSRYAGIANRRLIADETPHEAVFQFPGGLSDHLKEQVGARECATAEFFRGGRISRMVKARSNGRGPGRCGARAARPTIATRSRRRRRHARTGHPLRPDARPARLRRAGRAEEGQGHPGRRMRSAAPRSCFRLHPRSAIPEPDQGPA